MHDSASPYVSLTPKSARLRVGPFRHHKHLMSGDGDSLIVLHGSIKSLKSDDTNTNTDNSMLTDDLSQSHEDIDSLKKSNMALHRQDELQLTDSELKTSNLESETYGRKGGTPSNHEAVKLEQEKFQKDRSHDAQEFTPDTPNYFSGSTWNFGRSRISLPGSKKLYEPVLCSFRRSTPYEPPKDNSAASIEIGDSVSNKSDSPEFTHL